MPFLLIAGPLALDDVPQGKGLLGGAAGYAAIAAAPLARTQLWARGGQDITSQVRGILEHRGIDLSGVSWDGATLRNAVGAPTTSANALPEIEPTQAEVVRSIYRALVEEQLSCRQITKRLNETKTPTPSGKNQVWQPATVRNILTNQTYAGTARYNHRQPVLPHYRKTDESQLRDLKTGRSYRPDGEWVLTEAPALITPELFEKAQLQL